MLVPYIYKSIPFFKELLSLCIEYWFEFSPPIVKIDKCVTQEAQRMIREIWNLFMKND